jgi:N-acetylmuramoyl-L-alanine amidase
METTTIICPTILADVLVSLGIAKLHEAPKAPEAPKQPEPVKPLWWQFIYAVKSSDMTDAMKVACVAQAINESARGTASVPRECFNFHGMKMRDELEGLAVGKEMKVNSEPSGKGIFAKFPDVATGIKGWLKFLTRSYYKGWEAYENDAAGFIRHIGKSWTPKKTYADEVIRGFAEAEILLGITLPQDQISNFPKAKKRIFLDPGHAESKAGARSAKGAQEEDLNRLQAQVIKEQLEKTGRFDVTIFDPATDNLVEIGKAAKGHDMSIHLHHNSYAGSEDPGSEVLFDNDKAEAQSKELAEKMSAAISRALGTKNRGAKPFAGTVMDVAEQQGTFPVVLTESYFLNMYSQGAAEQRSTLAAVAIADVVEDWF